MRNLSLFPIVSLLIVPSFLFAGDIGPGADMAERMRRLEMEAEMLRDEIDWLRDRSGGQAPTQAVTVGMSTMSIAPQEQPEFYTLEEFTSIMKDMAWSKGDFKIVPYGILWGNAAYETERTSPGVYTLFVPSADTEGEDAFHIDTRRTRLGLSIAGPDSSCFGGVKSGGKAEIDFHGAFAIENKPGVLLRHAYAEVYNSNFKILAGQTWDVISPLNPGTVSYTVGWGGGNIGYRRAQIRLERYLTLMNDSKITFQGSLNQNIVSDFSSTLSIQSEASDWPLIEGRMAYSLGSHNPITVGVSGHIGEQGFDFTQAGPAPLNLPPRDDARVGTWSLNIDVKVPFNHRSGFQGEFFTGQNLGTFLGGIVQGVDGTSRQGIRSTGGWCDFWYDWTNSFHSRIGCGIDDPVDNDVFSGRIYNHYIYANSTYDLTNQLNVGFEVSSWKTMHVGQRPGDSVRFEFAGKYVF